MPYINLIAEQRKAKQHRERLARAWFFAFIGVSLFGLMGIGYLVLRSEAASADMRQLQAKLDELKPYQKQIAASEAILSELKPRLDTLTKARLDTERWWRILDYASLVTPPDTWLTRMKAVAGHDVTKPVQIDWTGVSVDQNLIGEFMLRMQKTPDLAEVALKYTEQKRGPQGTGLEFTITSIVPGTEELTRPANKEGEQS